MRSNNIIGVIFANVNDDKMTELTGKRTMGSVPFGGKYRMIDFVLSNMSNSGINQIAVVARNNYFSLMDHCGSGAAWDLSKRRTGLTIIPPSSGSDTDNRVSTLYELKNYFLHQPEEYILITGADFVTNIDYQKVYHNHISTGADITLIYKKTTLPKLRNNPVVLDIAQDGRITDIFIKPYAEGEFNLATGSILIKKDLLINLIDNSVSLNKLSFKRDILQANVKNLKMFAYEQSGYLAFINSIADYFKANMDLMCPTVRQELFNLTRPIYTKVRDDMPSRYGLGSSVKNSLIAQGCVIDGEVENSIISKGVYIGKGAKIKNCIIMNDTSIEAGCNLNYVIVDKDVIVRENRQLMGYDTYPICISKGSIV